MNLSRRHLLRAGLGSVLAAVAAACDRTAGGPSAAPSPSPSSPAASPASLAPTPRCDDGDEVTPAQTEGPYFKIGSPERADIRAGAGGTPLVVAGTVVTTACRPVARALVEFWQADDAGEYDNGGYRLRGHQFTDAQGRYRVQTVVPGIYPGRTRHIHVTVQAPGGPALTTQLYFPGEAGNASDGIFREECLLDIRDAAGGGDASFRFVVAT